MMKGGRAGLACSQLSRVQSGAEKIFLVETILEFRGCDADAVTAVKAGFSCELYGTPQRRALIRTSRASSDFEWHGCCLMEEATTRDFTAKLLHQEAGQPIDKHVAEKNPIQRNAEMKMDSEHRQGATNLREHPKKRRFI